MKYNPDEYWEDLAERYEDLTGEKATQEELEDWLENGCSQCGANPMTVNCNNANCTYRE